MSMNRCQRGLRDIHLTRRLQYLFTSVGYSVHGYSDCESVHLLGEEDLDVERTQARLG